MIRCTPLGLACALLALSLATFASPLSAQTTPPSCSDASALRSGTDPAALRLPTLEYECMRLSSGRHLLVGSAGARHRPAALLIHGLGTNAHRDWREVIPALATDHHVITLDLPGFGGSDTLPQGYSFEA